MLRRKKILGLGAWGFSALLFFAMVALAEFVAGFVVHTDFWNSKQRQTMRNYDLRNAYGPVRLIRGFPTDVPNSSYRSIARLKTTREVLFDVNISIDKRGRRKTPPPPGPDVNLESNKHLIFMGCSYTQGFGVADDQTLPYYVASFASGYRAYNLARTGGSAPETLGDIEIAEFFEDIPEKKGIAIFVAIDDQIRRFTGNYRLLANYLADRPMAEKDTNGRWTANRSWAQSSAARVTISNWMDSSNLLRMFNFTWPRIGHRERVEYVEILAAIKEKYLQNFGRENRFVVVLHFDRAEYLHSITRDLRRHGIEYLDYSQLNLESITGTPPYLAMHPTAAANRAIGKMIRTDLGLDQNR